MLTYAIFLSSMHWVCPLNFHSGRSANVLLLNLWQLKISLLQVCCYESMQAGQHRLKRLGIKKLTQPMGLASAMNQLPDEAIELAAAAHIERELQITSWNLTSNFVACTNQVLHSIYIVP
jgi:hypothetical protein